MANGLTEKEEKALRIRLARIEAILTRRQLLGGNETRALWELADSIRLRLDPPVADDLEAQADKMLHPRTGIGGVPWASAILAELP
jgi:hypothetical protein